VAVVALGVLAACGGEGGDSGGSASEVTDGRSQVAQPRFTDATAGSGIAYEIGYLNTPGFWEVEQIATGGAAAGDYDNDGDIDLFITRGDIGPNLLYRNMGNLVFEDIASSAGVAFTKSATENYRHSGPTFADMDGDGDLDLFLGGLFGDPSLLFSNNGDGTFSDVTAGSGIDALVAEQTMSAAFGDYDLDGDVDLFLAHWGTPRDQSNPGDTEHLWRNDSTGGVIRFTSVSESANISPSILNIDDPNAPELDSDHTFAQSFARINDDLYPDIVSVADFNYTQYFINNQDGTFSNATDTRVFIDCNGMGSAVGDYDNDGDLDWFVTSIFDGCSTDPTLEGIGNRLYRNVDGFFEDATDEAGVADGGWGWAACFADFENDGDLDIYHTNGWSAEGQPVDSSRAFVSDGTGGFVDRAQESGLLETEQGRGIVCADFDDDGDVDFLLLHRASPVSATLWRNDASVNNYLRVRLNGLPPNTKASGARLQLSVGDVQQTREVIIGTNFVSQNPTVQLFGLGAASQADELVVHWPDGLQTTLSGVAAGQTIVIDHPSLQD
jgi:hypothetical protein